MLKSKNNNINSQYALPGRKQSMIVSKNHFVKNTPVEPPFPVELEKIILGLGCFWGAEKCFWELGGVYSTAVGYSGGYTPNPTYEEVCSGMTGHAEVVLVVYNPKEINLEKIIRVFFESHDPTQGMRQGNDIGTQYRSAIFTDNDGQKKIAQDSADIYQKLLYDAGYKKITTEISLAKEFYYAEDVHQQYLAKNPGGYCGLGGLGISLTKTNDVEQL